MHSARKSPGFPSDVHTLKPIELASDLDRIGLTAFTTTREAGDFSWRSREPAGDVLERWLSLAQHLPRDVQRVVHSPQIHGSVILDHQDNWQGLLRAKEADGHFSSAPGTMMVVTLADCVPVFIGHPSGAAAILHSGWKGTEANIAAEGVRCFTNIGFRAQDLVAHCGPAICGQCYEVGADVYGRLAGRNPRVSTPSPSPSTVDLRALIARQLERAGVRDVSVSQSCTRCDNGRFFSHRAGDSGRHVGVVVSR
ncbi:MAG: Polyphenol oxidase [Gemmatimonadaceae bacterium]|nr:Polyphenol oxidase [Gemmatimonadaceae bacterium]